MSNNDLEKILEDMRKITMLTGEISDVHEKNLKQWPYILFDNVQEVEIKYDLTKDRTKEVGQGYIQFDVTTDLEQQHVEIKGDNLSKWARDMLWKEIEIRIKINGEIKYRNSGIE